MPPFRVVARHPDRGHHDHGWAQVGGTFDSLEDATHRITAAASADPVQARSLAPDERVVSDPYQRVHTLSYDHKVQELVATRTEDQNGFPADVEHTWKDVRAAGKED